MSRSFKKHPYCGDESSKKFGKKYANKKIRRLSKNNDYILNNKSYKKAYESYNICDYRALESFNEFKCKYKYNPTDGKYYDDFNSYTEKDLYNEWFSIYKRK